MVQLVGLGIVGIGELIDEVRTLALGDGRAQVLVILRMAFAHIRARQHHFGAERAQVEDFSWLILSGNTKMSR